MTRVIAIKKRTLIVHDTPHSGRIRSMNTLSDDDVSAQMPEYSESCWVIDARGLYCPEPVMLLHKAVRDTLPGQLMELLATDPSTQRDVVKFCQFLGHTLLEQRSEGDCFYFRIQHCNHNPAG